MTKPFPNFFDFDVNKVFAEFKFPGVDVEAITAAQRKNVEALTQANKLAFEGFQAVARRQAEIFRQLVEETQVVTRELVSTAAPDAKLIKETDLLKSAFEKAQGNLTELSEMISKSNKETVDILNKRFLESLDELKAAIEKAKLAK